MRYFSQAGIYKNSTGTNYFNPERCEAFSYDWWQYVRKYNGKVFFNSYSYSATTNRHQYKTLELLKELNIEIDFYIDVPKGLQHINFISSAIDCIQCDINELERLIDAPNSRNEKNIERIDKINYLEKKIDSLKKIA